jgi:DNA-binding NarL/FixJ family response regulator
MRAVKYARARRIGAPQDAQLTLILIDDHAILRDGVRALLEAERDLQVIAEAASLAEGIALVKRLRPDIVIIDISFPAGSGIEAIGTLRRECEGVTIVVLTVHNNPECLHAATRAGADEFVAKHAAYETLLRAIRSSISRNAQTARALPSARLRADISMQQHPSLMRNLTLRERQVLVGVAQGDNSKQIAAKLGRSVKTIVKHRSNMMRKLSLHDASAVTRFAIVNGLLPS